MRNLVAPAKTPEKCSLSMMDVQETGVPHKTDQAKSLFLQQSVRGWWPCSIEQDGKKTLGVSMRRKLLRDRCCLGKQSLFSGKRDITLVVVAFHIHYL